MEKTQAPELCWKDLAEHNAALRPPAAQIFPVCENNILTHKLPDPVHLQICYLKCTTLILKELTYGKWKIPQKKWIGKEKRDFDETL